MESWGVKMLSRMRMLQWQRETVRSLASVWLLCCCRVRNDWSRDAIPIVMQAWASLPSILGVRRGLLH